MYINNKILDFSNRFKELLNILLKFNLKTYFNIF